MECRKYKTRNMYIRHYAMRAGTIWVVTKVTPVTPIRLWLRFFRRVFSFSSFHSGHVPDCVALWEQSIALFLCAIVHKQTRLRVSFFWGADFKLRFKNSYPDQNDAQGRYDAIRSIPACSRLHWGELRGFISGIQLQPRHFELEVKVALGFY